ncbi:AzlC family ABC transporter permease [Intrasporangium sp.]|uniref:AzlC family ABC transporter permease n=1 Tax=Intrasporangium sp. TaxID=1925024 RepID=UPI002939BBF2|nr:AzlC family ABC transporter permease [Intrasporangium sp.]MDV3222775.1 AzlC family ABC transporter permease [Intrasporangium sp.]
MSAIMSMRDRTDRSLLRSGRTERRELGAGALAMLPLVIGYVPFALVVGVAVARSTDVLAAWTGTLTVYGGSAQLALLELLASGAAAWTAAGAAVLINARLLVYSLALVPTFASAALPVRLVAAAFVIEPTWVVALQRAESPGTDAERRWHFAGATLTLTLGWLLVVTAGLALGQLSLPVLSIVGPICLLAIVLPHLRLPGGLAAVLAAAAATVGGVRMSLPSGAIPLLAMGVAAAAGLLASRQEVHR